MSNTVSIDLDQEIADKVNSMTKKELAEKMVIATLEAHVARQDVEALQTKLDKAEAYVEQGRAMISAVMERWYEYDV